MAEEQQEQKEHQHHHHHLFHHHKEEGSEEGNKGAPLEGSEEHGRHDYAKDEKAAKHKEHVGELGAVAAGAFALYEKHKAKKDPENAHRHKIEEEIAATVAVGAGGYAWHEHHNKKEAKKEAEEEKPKHHHIF